MTNIRKRLVDWLRRPLAVDPRLDDIARELADHQRRIDRLAEKQAKRDRRRP